MIVIFLGPPGCGKGTQARLLEPWFKQVSTGDLLRNELENGGPLSAQLKETLGQGRLGDDGIVFQLLTRKLEETKDENVLLDGFPRRLSQAEMLEGFLKTQKRHIDQVIVFDVPESILMERIQGRFSCVQCGELYNDIHRPTTQEGVCNVCQGREFKRRSDDSVDVLKERLKVYAEETKLLESHYQTIHVDAVLPVAVLHQHIRDILGIS